MSLAGLAVLLCGLGVLVSAGLAYLFVRDPRRAMQQTTHRPEQLPLVMADRYAAFALLALFAALYRDMTVIAVLFAVYAMMAFVDAAIYARAGHPATRHTLAGVASAAVTVVALLAR